MPLLIDTATLAARFPLVARSRPPARSLTKRVDRLSNLAETAAANHDPDTASMVFNGAALLASDCGAGELARAWCRWHAKLYLNQARLNGHTARFALEPLVNLGRLRIRAGDGDGAYQLLTKLYQAVTARTSTDIDGVELCPKHIPASRIEHDALIGWLRGILLSDGTRALTATSKWSEAVAHVQQHNGVTSRLHDGRQVIVLGHLLEGDTSTAATVLQKTVLVDPWEAAVHAVFSILSRQPDDDGNAADHRNLIDIATSKDLGPGHGLAVFRTRLSLTAIDLANGHPELTGTQLFEHLCQDAAADDDANAARDLLNSAINGKQRGLLAVLIRESFLDRGKVPDDAYETLTTALSLAGKTIRERRDR